MPPGMGVKNDAMLVSDKHFAVFALLQANTYTQSVLDGIDD